VSFSDAASEQIESDARCNSPSRFPNRPTQQPPLRCVRRLGDARHRYTAIPDTLVFEPGVTETNV
jgi:hypothetical protein